MRRIALGRWAVALALTTMAMLVAGSAPAAAQDANAIAAKHLYAGSLAAGEAELSALVAREPQNGSARFALAGTRVLQALERLAQSMHRHGLEAPRSFVVPILRLPVPSN